MLSVFFHEIVDFLIIDLAVEGIGRFVKYDRVIHFSDIIFEFEKLDLVICLLVCY
jgi:hypothetical protein